MSNARLSCFKIRVFNYRLAFFNFIRYVQTFFTGGEKCLCCSASSGIIPLCKECQKKLTFSESSEKCQVCGKELVSERGVCSSCRNERLLFNADRVYPLASYRLWRKNLLFDWKIREKRVLSPFFASLVYKKLTAISPDKNHLLPAVPVPPRPGKIRIKGWDQIDELCFYLKNMYGVKVLQVLERRTRYQQKKLNRLGRLESAGKAFVLKREKRLKSISNYVPESVVLIDDVMTTGSTVEACAAELKKWGVKNVAVITLFTVD